MVHQRLLPCRRLPQTGEKTGRRRLADASGPYAGMGRPLYRQPPAEDLQKMAVRRTSPPSSTPTGPTSDTPRQAKKSLKSAD